MLFIDADDFIADGSLSVLCNEIKREQADIFFLKAEKIYPDGSTAILEDAGACVKDAGNRVEVIQKLAHLNKYPGSACTKLVKRQMLLEHEIYFEESVRQEDLIWSLRCILCAKNYGYVDVDYYFYRKMREGQTTGTFTVHGALGLNRVITQGIELARQADKSVRDSIYAMMAYEAEVLLMYYGQLSRGDRKNIRPKVQSVRWLLKYRRQRRTKMLRLLLGVTGLDAGSRILAAAYLVRERGLVKLCSRFWRFGVLT